MAESSSKLSLKLLIDTQNNRVLFAEADKSAVDFLFHILSLPVGTVIRLLNKQEMVGCLANLYHSVENLSETYVQSKQTKDNLLKPKPPVGALSSPMFSLPHNETLEKTFYGCNNTSYHACKAYVSDESSAVCPQCQNIMCRNLNYVALPAVKEQTVGNGESAGGFVKGVVTYMVMDDLVVKPMSTISSITLLNKFNVKELGVLEEKEVDLGIDQALMLLKTSMESKNVLTTVFLKNQSKNIKEDQMINNAAAVNCNVKSIPS